jgi:hypothetical protein
LGSRAQLTVPGEGRSPNGPAIEERQATIAGAINSASLFFGVLTRLLTGVATMCVSYCRSSLNTSPGATNEIELALDRGVVR